MKRGILIHPEELNKKWVDRIADSGLDVLGIHPVGGSKAGQSFVYLSECVQSPDFRKLLDYAEQRGLEIEYEIHAAQYLMPRELFREHPEYFRMDEEEKRNPDKNFCVSSKEGMEVVAQRAVELAKMLYKSCPVFYFWLDDIRNKECHCPECRKYSASDQQLIFVNRALREIRKEIPDAKMAYLAYYDCIRVPEKVLPEKGVFLEYAPIEKYRLHISGDPSLAEEEKQMLKPLLSYFGSEDSKVLEYWLDNSLFSEWKKPPKPFVCDAETTKKEIAEYRRIGFEDIGTFGCYLGEDYEALYGEPDIHPYTEVVRTLWK